jgi:hypothetical protein
MHSYVTISPGATSRPGQDGAATRIHKVSLTKSPGAQSDLFCEPQVSHQALATFNCNGQVHFRRLDLCLAESGTNDPWSLAQQ